MFGVVPVAIEALGAIGDEALAFLRDLGERIASVLEESLSYQFLYNGIACPYSVEMLSLLAQCKFCNVR